MSDVGVDFGAAIPKPGTKWYLTRGAFPRILIHVRAVVDEEAIVYWHWSASRGRIWALSDPYQWYLWDEQAWLEFAGKE